MPEEKQSVDGISEPPELQEQEAAVSTGSAPSAIQSRLKFVILLALGLPYVLYIGWCVFLLYVLPNPDGVYESLIPLGRITGFSGAILLAVIAFFAGGRVLSKSDELQRYKIIMGLVRIGAPVIPGIILGVVMPFIIASEPSMWISITEPLDTQELIAPIAVTLSVEKAKEILERRGVNTISFSWDFDGDGNENEETVLPTATAFYQRMGAYNVGVKIRASDGRERMITHRVSVQKEVFSIVPPRPILDEPVRFSVEYLVDDADEIQEVQWDFDSDGIFDEVKHAVDVIHTFNRTGDTNVSAIVLMQNQTQQKHERTITIFAPEPLPFPVEIGHEPAMLVGPAPLQTLFWLETEEPIRQVTWDFGDGEELDGQSVGHTFESEDGYMVTALIRSEAGDTAKLSEFVRVVDELKIQDLTFDGSIEVDQSEKLITGEVPLILSITPRSSLPLITYHWEAPDATEVGSTDTTLEVIYRRPGTYTVTLLAQDAAGDALRLPIRVEVVPPSSLVLIDMEPEGGVAPLEVMFDGSETRIPNEEISGFEWYFGAEGKEELAKQGGAVMSYKYTEPGTYKVRLVARTVQGNNYEESKTIVVRAPLLDACFTASRTSGPSPLGVKFDMFCTTGQTEEIKWDFGDRVTTDEPNPVHVFEDSGEYTVSLDLRDPRGSVSTQTMTITVE